MSCLRGPAISWRISLHHSRVSLSHNWMISSSPILKLDCPALLWANYEFYEKHHFLFPFSHNLIIKQSCAVMAPSQYESLLTSQTRLVLYDVRPKSCNQIGYRLHAPPNRFTSCVVFSKQFSVEFSPQESFPPQHLSSTPMGRILMNRPTIRWTPPFTISFKSIGKPFWLQVVPSK